MRFEGKNKYFGAYTIQVVLFNLNWSPYKRTRPF